MITIKRKQFLVNLEDIIFDLKDELSEIGISRFSEIKNSGDWLLVTCPYHKNGQESKASCGINKDSGYLHCFTCGEKHPLYEVIEDCFDEEPGFGMEWLSEHYDNEEIKQEREINIDLNRNEKQEFLNKDELKKYRKIHPYAYKRKLTKDIIRRYDIGYDEETDCLTFPVFDYNGNLLFIARRSVKTKYFNYPKHSKKPVYGVYQLKRDYPKCKEVIICESMINALTCEVYGKRAIALNGTGSSSQLKDLENLPYRTYILGLDPDDAGENGCKKIIKALKGKKLLKKLIIPKGKDINDLSKEEFDNLDEIYI